jgi:hypothetical protein
MYVFMVCRDILLWVVHVYQLYDMMSCDVMFHCSVLRVHLPGLLAIGNSYNIIVILVL